MSDFQKDPKLDTNLKYSIVCFMKKRALVFGLALGLASCGREASPGPNMHQDATLAEQQAAFTQAVDDTVFDEGREINLDLSVPCDTNLLIGDLTVRRVLADETDYSAFVVQDAQGKVPEFGLVQCFDVLADGTRIVRAADGY